jgi:DNA polymerase III subunit delta
LIRLFYGPDTLSRQEHLAQFKRGLDSDGMLESNTTLLDGTSVQPAELVGQCNTSPFLATKRLVIVDGLLRRTQRRRESATVSDAAGEDEGDGRAGRGTDGLPAWRFLREFAADLPATTELVLLDDVGSDNQLARDLAPVSEVCYFPLPSRSELPDWVRKRAAGKGLNLSAKATAGIAEAVGPDLWTLNNELEKMSVFAASSESTSESEVLGLLASRREASVFFLCDAIVEGRTGQALGGLRRLVEEGQAPQYILTMIGRHYRLLTLARDGIEQRLTPGQIMDRLETRSQFVVDKTVKQARNYTLPLLRRCYQRIVQTDLDIKTGLFADEVALELLVGDLSSAGRR